MPSFSRPVVGLLASSTVESWATRQWQGVVDAARDLNVELVCYIGGVLRSSRYDEEANVMYDLAALARLDGLIVWSAAIGWLIPKPDMSAFVSRFGALPIVSMEMSFPGAHSVLMDDYGGMRAVIDHLIEEHGRRRIAFLRGPATHEGFEARYRAYLASLEAHGLPFDPSLVVQILVRRRHRQRGASSRLARPGTASIRRPRGGGRYPRHCGPARARGSRPARSR